MAARPTSLRASSPRSETREPQEIFFALASEDVRRAADLLEPVYLRSGGTDGFASFECTPDVAHEADGTFEQAPELGSRLDRKNVMIEVPATEAGVPAIWRPTCAEALVATLVSRCTRRLAQAGAASE